MKNQINKDDKDKFYVYDGANWVLESKQKPLTQHEIIRLRELIKKYYPEDYL
jgi:hypothetical protein